MEILEGIIHSMMSAGDLFGSFLDGVPATFGNGRVGPGIRDYHRGARTKNLSARHPLKHAAGPHPSFGANERARAARRRL